MKNFTINLLNWVRIILGPICGLAVFISALALTGFNPLAVISGGNHPLISAKVGPTFLAVSISLLVVLLVIDGIQQTAESSA